MKIGIVTFWQTRDNYGQMLQCLALQNILEKLGHVPYLVRYLHSEHEYPWQDYVKNGLRMLVHLRWKRIILKRKKLSAPSEKDTLRDFETFKFKYLKVSELTYYSLSELRRNPPLADCYIVGSDQVWSKLLFYRENQVFYLNFGHAKIRRISYAASFSRETYPGQLEGVLRKMLLKFDSISVREKSGVEICKKVGFKAHLVADPSLLLKGDEYLKLFNIVKKRKNKIFIYSLNISDAEEIRWGEISQYANLHNQSILVTPSSGYIASKELFGDEVDYQYCTIPEWLNNIVNSSLVVTTSFHGIAFCLLFHTPFIFVPLYGHHSRGNSRVTDLLEKLGDHGHVLGKDTHFIDCLTSPYSWLSIDGKMEDFRNESMAYLQEALS